MTRTIGMVLVIGILAAGALAEAEKRLPTPAERMAAEEREMQMNVRKAEIMHQQALRELALEARRVEIDRQRHRVRGGHRGHGGCAGPVLLVLLTLHILLTVWVCKDMREQKIGRKLWVPIVLLGGFCGAGLYALVRIADTRNRPADD